MEYSAKLGTVAGSVAAAAWLAISVESIVRPGEHDYRDGLILFPWVLTMVAFCALHSAQRGRSGLLEQRAFRFVIGAMAATAIGDVGMIVGSKVLAVLAFPIGPLVWIPAMIAWGVGCARAGLAPKWVGAAIAAAEPLTMVVALALSPISPVVNRGSYTGALVNGLVVAAVALVLLALGRERADSLQLSGIPSR